MHLERDRVAVITGAASGIGLALAGRAAEAGMRLVLADVDADRLEAAAGNLRTISPSVALLVADVSAPEAIERIAETAFAAGSVQLVCSNAGIVVPGRSWEIPAADWQRVIDINLMATVRLVQAFVPRLLEASAPAHLLVTGSMACVTARPGIAPYVTAKHGLLGLCEALAHELATTGTPVGVSLVMPGQVITGMTDRMPPTTAISAEDVAAIALDAVADGRLFTFTQADRVPEVERRFAAIVAGQTPVSPA